MAYQENSRFLSPSAHRRCGANSSSVVFAPLEHSHRPKRVRTNGPQKARPMLDLQPVADAVVPRVKQGLPAATAVIPNSILATTVRHRSVVGITEPRAVLEQQTPEPFVFELLERLDAQVSGKVFSVGVELRAIAAFTKGSHAELEPADSPRDTDTAKRPVIPNKADTRTRTAGIKSYVRGK
jgi:hypothetical protein